MRSWEYGNCPKATASVPLAGGSTIDVHAVAERWNQSHIIVAWADKPHHKHWPWAPAGNIRRVIGSEWDIEDYRRFPAELRSIRWATGSRDSCPPSQKSMCTLWANTSPQCGLNGETGLNPRLLESRKTGENPRNHAGKRRPGWMG
ncbi:hypothetical protein NicSoilC12_36410 [Arthrobacter sp. NicSoilC12]|nr:hypothetical protein NicSoilC12_36410 [Arthrobacter sp. NicSoilC12]